MRQYVTGSNSPGYLPEVEPRGPWNGWEDSMRDVASMIDQDAEEMEEDPDADVPYIAAQKASALADLRAEPEHADGCDVLFMGRAYFIRPAEKAGADD